MTSSPALLATTQRLRTPFDTTSFGSSSSTSELGYVSSKGKAKAAEYRERVQDTMRQTRAHERFVAAFPTPSNGDKGGSLWRRPSEATAVSADPGDPLKRLQVFGQKEEPNPKRANYAKHPLACSGKPCATLR